MTMISPADFKIFSLSLLLLIVSLNDGQTGHALDNGLARTPPMGWIAWERFTCTTDCRKYPRDCLNEQLFRDMAHRMAEDGYKEAGYEYINIDDCWSELTRDNATGNLMADLERFPNGITSLASYVHSKGLKLGLYGDCGTKTCANYPAQLKSEHQLGDNYFQLDANKFADWEVDSFKFDGCNLEASRAERICPQMALALNATQRPMVVICEWPFYMLRNGLRPNYTLAQGACNAWRYYEDVEDSWLSVLSIVDFTIRMQLDILLNHGPGSWFDPDQLVIGNFALSLDQARAQMALWCLWSAPLYMGNDLRHIEPEMAAILKNKELIDVDQDRLGVFGLMVDQQSNKTIQAFVKPVEPFRRGCPSFVIALLNRNTLGNSRRVSFELRRLLTRAPIALAHQRYKNLYSGDQNPGAVTTADDCKRLLKVGMTADDINIDGLLVRPVAVQQANVPVKPRIEATQVNFRMWDLFGDQPPSEIALNGTLNLDVNPSGIRVVRLQILD